MIPFFTRLKFAFKTFFALLFHGRIPDDVAITVGGTARGPDPSSLTNASFGQVRARVNRAERDAATTQIAAPAPVKAEPTAAQLLAVLQRDGRLIDFLTEDLASYSDAQIGAAVRNVHDGCRDAVRRYLTLAPVLQDEEGARIIIDANTNAARVKVIGNVAGQPPYQGIVRHRGWSLNGSELPSLPSAAPSVIAPAEVEVP